MSNTPFETAKSKMIIRYDFLIGRQASNLASNTGVDFHDLPEYSAAVDALRIYRIAMETYMDALPESEKKRLGDHFGRE